MALNQAVNTAISNCAGQLAVLERHVDFDEVVPPHSWQGRLSKTRQITLKLMSLLSKIARSICRPTALHFLIRILYS